MSFRRRLALFFVLLVVVPMSALILMLLFVSEDARRGKADARLAAGLQTAIALYGQRASEARAQARELARSPAAAADLVADRRGALRARAAREVARGEPVAIQILDLDGTEVASAGPAEAIAFGEVRVAADGEEIGTVRVSTSTASGYADDVKRLTSRELVVSRDGAPLAQTVVPPQTLPPFGETVDLELSEGEYRARQQSLDAAAGEAALMLGPRKEGGLLALGRPAVALLAAFLLVAALLAWMIARMLSALHERVAALAATDPLTGLWNRRRMQELLERESERHRRFQHPYSFLIVDVDNFKSINDEHGHPQGDAVLEGIAKTIDHETRSIDEAIRYGGDELALVLSETAAEGATVLAERLRDRIGSTSFPLKGGGELSVTVSIGAASVPHSAGDSEQLVQAADDALLEAKRSGKDRIVSAAPSRSHVDA